jgi:hypothetical protein
MSDEPRKATDILSSIEEKQNIILKMIQSLDMNMKVLSNKMNALNAAIINVKKPQTTPQIQNLPSIEAESVSTQNETVFIDAENRTPIQQAPQGARRTSRELENIKPANPIISNNEIVVPKQSAIIQNLKQSTPVVQTVQNQSLIPVTQRIVDGNGKSLFMAEVEIYSMDDEPVDKSRTNAAGKWTISLPIGQYKISMKKLEPISKKKTEAWQNIKVDGSQIPLVLPMAIIK